jgi:phage terminase small subunit
MAWQRGDPAGLAGAAPLDADSGWRAPPMKLTPKQARFVQEYLTDLNATQAAVRAGYSAKTARMIGHENRTKPNIAAAIERAMAEHAERPELTADWVIDELRKIAAANLADYVSKTSDGDPYLDFSALTRDQSAALSEVTVEDFVDGGRAARRVKFKLYDKRAALVDLGRHLGFFAMKQKQQDTTAEVDIEDVRETIFRTLARLSAARSAADGDPGAEPRSTTEATP